MLIGNEYAVLSEEVEVLDADFSDKVVMHPVSFETKAEAIAYIVNNSLKGAIAIKEGVCFINQESKTSISD